MHIHVVLLFELWLTVHSCQNSGSKACFVDESYQAKSLTLITILNTHPRRLFQRLYTSVAIIQPLYTYLVDVRRHGQADWAVLGLSLASSSSSMVSFPANQLLGRGLTFASRTWTENTGSAMNRPYLLKIIHCNGRPALSFRRITRLLTRIFAWNLDHWTQHTYSYRSIPKTRHRPKIPSAPFSHSGSHIIVHLCIVAVCILALPCSTPTWVAHKKYVCRKKLSPGWIRTHYLGLWAQSLTQWAGVNWASHASKASVEFESKTKKSIQIKVLVSIHSMCPKKLWRIVLPSPSC